MSVARVHMQHDLAQLAGRQREQAQHAPRPARLRFSAKTHGIGETRTTLSFGAYALDEPSFTFGVQALSSLLPGQLPTCTAIVMGYRKNEQGLYVGADMGFVVYSTNDTIKLQFSLTFESATMRSTAGAGSGATPSGTTQGTIYKA